MFNVMYDTPSGPSLYLGKPCQSEQEARLWRERFERKHCRPGVGNPRVIEVEQ
jgi:hypothetical protein